MSIHQKPDGRWCAVIYKNGKQRWRYFGRGAQAKRKAQEYDTIAKSVSPRIDASISFGHLVNLYLEAKYGVVADTTLDNQIYKFKSVILPMLGHVPAAAIDAKAIDHYVSSRIRIVKKVTIHREIADIQAVLNFAVSRQYVFSNPIKGLAKPKRDDDIIDPPTRDELIRILNHAGDHLRRAILLTYYTGLRPGNAELYRLKWSVVNWKDNTLSIISARKGGIRSRIIPMHPELASHLKTWYQADNMRQDWAIINYMGKTIASVKTAWKRAKTRAGIERRLRMYDLRHAAITGMIRAGGDLKTVSRIAGHSREDTTIRIYTHTNIDAAREAINRIPTLAKPANKDISQKNS